MFGIQKKYLILLLLLILLVILGTALGILYGVGVIGLEASHQSGEDSGSKKGGLSVFNTFLNSSHNNILKIVA